MHAHGAPLPAANNSDRDRSGGILDVGAHRCINAAANLKQGVSIRLMSPAVIYRASIEENLITVTVAANDAQVIRVSSFAAAAVALVIITIFLISHNCYAT